MARPITLFTGQWADLPLAELAPLARKMGYDGLELACWGDHFDVAAGAGVAAATCATSGRCWPSTACSASRSATTWSGQAVCDRIDARHESILPARVWGDGDPEGVRRRAARELQDTARAAAAFGVKTVTGFTGSSIWHAIYAFPPTTQAFWDAGFADFARPLRAHPAGVRRGRRQLRARGASDRDRVRHRHQRARDRGGRRPPPLRLQLRPQPPRLPGRRLHPLHPPASARASSTRT